MSATSSTEEWGRWLIDQDKFRRIPAELRASSRVGGIMTILTYTLLIILLFAEVCSFMTTSYSTVVKLDAGSDKMIQINFSIRMHYLPCEYLRIAVFNSFGVEKLDALSERIVYTPIDKNGANAGAPIEGSSAETTSEPSQENWDAELDSDWASSDDHFKHNSFRAAVTHHEFTMVFFYADWCSHCRAFHPTWNKMVQTISMQENFQNKAGNTVQVKLMKINCEDFASFCVDERIHAYPTIRLYSEDMWSAGSKPVPFVGQRNIDAIRTFLKENIQRSTLERHDHVMNDHGGMHEGCDVHGSITVPRVAGEFHLQATADRVSGSLNPERTDVSHTVMNLFFGDFEVIEEKGFGHLPLHPLDNKDFFSRDTGSAPQHYLKVVPTTLPKRSLVAYQIAHSNRIATVPSGEIPQAKFMYDISPMSVMIQQRKKPWYTFVTSLCALLGGFYTVMRLTSRQVLKMVAKKDV